MCGGRRAHNIKRPPSFARFLRLLQFCETQIFNPLVTSRTKTHPPRGCISKQNFISSALSHIQDKKNEHDDSKNTFFPFHLYSKLANFESLIQCLFTLLCGKPTPLVIFNPYHTRSKKRPIALVYLPKHLKQVLFVRYPKHCGLPHS